MQRGSDVVLIADLITADNWITGEAFERILEKTCEIVRHRRRSAREVFPASFGAQVSESALRALNETVAISMQGQFRQALGLNEKKFCADATAALRYFDLIDRLNKFGFEYRTADYDLRQQLEETIARLKSSEEVNGKLPHKWWEANFFPEILGLYAALFREKPTATFNRDSNTLPGAAFVFVREIIYEVKLSRNAETLFFVSEIDGLDLEEWQFHSEEALRNKINSWLKIKVSGTSELSLWEENSKFYESLLWQRCQ